VTTLAGTSGHLTVSIGGRRLAHVADASWEESVLSGTVARLDWLVEEDDDVIVGSPVRLDWEGRGRTEGMLNLWVRSVRRRTTREGVRVRVEATDPLGFCDQDPQFRTYAGRVLLAQLARAVLRFQPGELQGASIDSSNSPQLPQEWLLQCDESGAGFLRRIAAGVGCVPHWRRDRLGFGAMGRPERAEPIAIELGETVHMIEQVATRLPGPGQLVWTEQGSRRTHVEQIAANGKSAGRLSPAAHGSERPHPLAWVGRGRVEEWPDAARFTGGDPAWQPGARVRLGQSELVIDRVVHTFAARRVGTSYSSTAHAVPPGLWAAARVREPSLLDDSASWTWRRASQAPADLASTMIGPFQAIVADTRDPERLGRLRVTLAEDPERRASHWIPWLAPSAGNAIGSHWLPDRGQLVTVVAMRAAPENLIAIGAHRGADTRARDAWDSPDNTIKALAFRNGIEIVVDEERQELVLRTGAASLSLNGQGQVRINGRELKAGLDGPVDVKAAGVLTMDGSRIEIG
jgi:uncharacterized protein involved in type VI secretion and phage assembly